MRTDQALLEAIRAHGRTVLIVNTKSRRGQRAFDEARQLLADRGFDLLGVFPVVDPETMPNVFADALALRPDLVVVGGGDGTIAEAVGYLAHRDVAMGVLPLGTTNNFARGLELPVDVAGAIGVLRDGEVTDVDLGRIDGKIFANMVGFGLSVDISKEVPHGLKRAVGRAAYALTGFWRMARHKPFTATLHIDGEAHRVTTHQLNIANGAHHSGRRIAVDASPDDRLLAVYTLGDARLMRLAADTFRLVFTGHRRTMEQEQFLLTKRVRVETDRPLDVEVDGEIQGTTPVTVELLPDALRVMVGPSFTER